MFKSYHMTLCDIMLYFVTSCFVLSSCNMISYHIYIYIISYCILFYHLYYTRLYYVTGNRIVPQNHADLRQPQLKATHHPPPSRTVVGLISRPHRPTSDWPSQEVLFFRQRIENQESISAHTEIDFSILRSNGTKTKVSNKSLPLLLLEGSR